MPWKIDPEQLALRCNLLKLLYFKAKEKSLEISKKNYQITYVVK
jgi:hypothetical protein